MGQPPLPELPRRHPDPYIGRRLVQLDRAVVSCVSWRRLCRRMPLTPTDGIHAEEPITDPSAQAAVGETACRLAAFRAVEARSSGFDQALHGARGDRREGPYLHDASVPRDYTLFERRHSMTGRLVALDADLG
jgi:hypothetical protein